MAETVYDIGYEEALRSIGLQSGVLSELRGRAGTLLGAASLVTSFLGGAVLASPTLESGVVTRPPISGWGWLAIITFCAIGVLALLILWPYMWKFEMNPVSIMKTAESEGVAPAELMQDLAGYHWQNFESNQFKLDWLFWAFRLGCAALVFETVFWIVDLRT